MTSLLNRIDQLRNRESQDAGFAMMMALFLILIVSVATLAAAAVYINQVNPTRLDKKRVQTVNAAEAGLQAAAGLLNNTPKTSNGYGDLTQLPCGDTSDAAGVSVVVGSGNSAITVPGYQITGTVESPNTPGATSTYRAVIVYFPAGDDPTPHSHDPNLSTFWQTSPTTEISCKAGLVSQVPEFAYIESFGYNQSVVNQSATEGDRAIHATYNFSVVNNNNTLAGGRLAEFNSSAQDSECLDAGSAPAVGTVPKMEQCLPVGTAEQSWLYRSDLTIQYSGNTSLNLCIQNVTSTEGNAGVPTLETCETSGASTVTTYPYADATQQEQEWAYNDGGQLESPDVNDGSVGSGPCLEGTGASTSSAATNNQPLTVTGCSGSSTDLTAWNPDPAVGAGKSFSTANQAPTQYTADGVPSASATSQFANFELFGRCLDVNGQNFGNKLIAYPCKQAPDATTLTWNQIWHFKLVSGNYGIFYTNCAANAGGCVGGSTSTGEQDCLVSPSTENGLVTGVLCPTSSYPTSELWQASGSISGDYNDSYELVSDSSGYCMAPDPGSQSGGWDQIVATNCSGTDLPNTSSSIGQLLTKWNAPPNNPGSKITGLGETSGSGAILGTS